MSKDGPVNTPIDPFYPRLVLTPMADGWMVEIDFSQEYCVATGPFDDVYEALEAGMIRLDKQSTLDDHLNRLCRSNSICYSKRGYVSS